MTTERRPHEPRIKNVAESLQNGIECIDLLLRECAPELARMVTGLEERPTESELPEVGLKRHIRALELLTRAVEQLEFGADQLEEIEAARAWDAAQERRTPKPPLRELDVAGALGNLAKAHSSMEEVLTDLNGAGDAETIAESVSVLANIRLAESQLKGVQESARETEAAE